MSPFRQETIDMGVFILYIPYGKSRLRVFRKVTFGAPEIPTLLEVLGAWMTFKKAEMAKTLKNGSSMIETNLLNHNCDSVGVGIAPV